MSSGGETKAERIEALEVEVEHLRREIDELRIRMPSRTLAHFVFVVGTAMVFLGVSVIVQESDWDNELSTKITILAAGMVASGVLLLALANASTKRRVSRDWS